MTNGSSIIPTAKIRVAVAAAAIAVVGLVGGPAPQASAGENYGAAYRVSGSPVQVDCNYKHGPYPVIPHEYGDGGRWNSVSPTPICKSQDVDRARSWDDGRCLKYAGPGVRDGWYYAKADKWYKIKGGGIASFHAYTSKKCSKSKEYPYT